MSDRVFRIYKRFAAIMCVCAVIVGGFLGMMSLKMERKPAEEPAEPSKFPVQTTVMSTTVPTELPMTEKLFTEEQIYQEYFAASEYRGGRYTLQDLDGNGVREMLIWPNEDVHEIVTVVGEQPVVLLSDYGLFLCEGNVIGQYGEGSGGCTVWYYEINGSVAQPIVCIVWMFHEDAWYTSTDYSGEWDTMIPITEDEKSRIVSQYLPQEKDIPETGYLHFLYHDIMN